MGDDAVHEIAYATLALTAAAAARRFEAFAFEQIEQRSCSWCPGCYFIAALTGNGLRSLVLDRCPAGWTERLQADPIGLNSCGLKRVGKNVDHCRWTAQEYRRRRRRRRNDPFRANKALVERIGKVLVGDRWMTVEHRNLESGHPGAYLLDFIAERIIIAGPDGVKEVHRTLPALIVEVVKHRQQRRNAHSARDKDRTFYQFAQMEIALWSLDRNPHAGATDGPVQKSGHSSRSAIRVAREFDRNAIVRSIGHFG